MAMSYVDLPISDNYPSFQITDGMDIIAENDYFKMFVKRWTHQHRNRSYPLFDVADIFPGVESSAICTISMDVKVDVPLDGGSGADWFSFASVKMEPSDDWTRVLVANMEYNNELFLYHVPTQNAHTGYTRYNLTKVPMNEWFNFRMDINCTTMQVAVYQDDVMIESAAIEADLLVYGFHFGFYSNGEVKTGYVCNKNLRIGIDI